MSGAPAAAPAAKPQTLDELMLAMDVVDTIRHRELIVERALGESARDDELRNRLREIYRGQGIEVSDRAIDQGIKALKESRFVYTPPPPGLARTLALVWIYRGRIVGTFFAIVVGAGLLWGGYQYGIVAPAERAAETARVELAETLPKALQTAYDMTLREARADAARGQADALASDGRAAIARKDAAGARTAIAGLETLRAKLVQTYQLRIISDPDKSSGVWRYNTASPDGRNYYLIVEAIGSDGRALTMPVTSEEDNRTYNVAAWGVRVPEATFNAVRDDKRDNGIIENRVVGEKGRGELEPRYRMNVLGGAITSWDE
jgi:hypothetical protein